MKKMPERKYARTFPRPARLVRIAFFSIILWAAVLALPYFLYQMFTQSDQEQRMAAIWALVALIVGVLAKVIIYVTSSRTRCPLCQGNIFHRARCHMHENARLYPMMSYSTTIVVDMLLFGRFICKYCGTAFRLKK